MKRKRQRKNTEISIDNIRLDKLTKEYLTEIKKSDADVEAARWQLLYYLKVLKEKGIVRKGRLEFIEKNKSDKKVIYVELTEENEKQLEVYIQKIDELIQQEKVPECLAKHSNVRNVHIMNIVIYKISTEI